MDIEDEEVEELEKNFEEELLKINCPIILESEITKEKVIGEEYDYKSHLEFEVEYKNGKKNGKWKEYYNNGKLKFNGEYLNGKKWNGKGYNVYGDIIYELKNGKGYIIEYDDNKLIFEGEYLNGIKNGKGKEYEDEKWKMERIL